MKKIILLLLISFCLIKIDYAQNLCDIDPELQQLLNSKEDEFISVNIILKSQIDVKNLDSRSQSFDKRGQKRNTVLKEFKKFAEESQSDVLSVCRLRQEAAM